MEQVQEGNNHMPWYFSSGNKVCVYTVYTCSDKMVMGCWQPDREKISCCQHVGSEKSVSCLVSVHFTPQFQLVHCPHHSIQLTQFQSAFLSPDNKIFIHTV